MDSRSRFGVASFAASCVLALTPFSSCASTHASRAVRAADSAPNSIAYGYQSGLREASRVIVRDAKEWARVWNQHESFVVPPPPLPEVDFAREMVIGVCIGPRPTGGYGVRIRSVQKSGDKLVVDVVETRPAEGAIVPMVVTQPYEFVRVPRFDGTVEFRTP